jgi:hypothetical protein
MKQFFVALSCLALIPAAFAASDPAKSAAQQSATAWQNGRFQVDLPGVVGRSDIVLGKPNLEPGQAMPLGNGNLGVAVWSAEGFTAQLNRNDTMPDRLSPGQVVIPGLAALTAAKDYSGRLDLYRGEFREQGGGMKATAWVGPDSDVLVVDVTGADPTQPQTAMLKLWAPRTPHAQAIGRVGQLSEAWVDNTRPESSGRAFGSLSAITAEGRDVSAAVTDPLTVTVTFKPFPDGHFRILAAAPHYDGKGNAQAIAARALLAPPDALHLSHWRAFWNRVAPIEITSADSAGEYMENLRNIYLYVAAVERGSEYPGSQAGTADMISAAQDLHKWDSSAFWHWNLRMQVAANIGAGLADLNTPYFHLYRGNLAGIEKWTTEHMNGLPGVCVPETMRFNGRGIEYESSWNPIAIGRNCDAGFKPYYNARTLTTGAEVSLWVWQQYLATNDRKFLEENYPLMASSARFLLAYQKPGPDGLLHTGPSNAHETQWDVSDPTTDIAAMMALYPATIQAAKLLGKDPGLVRRLEAALPRIPPFPRIPQSGPRTLLPSSADGDQANGTDVIAESYEPAAEIHNIENIGLEPVWPYSLIGDASPHFPLAQRTYAHRPNIANVDWSFDPIQAARLGLGGEVGSTLIATTEKFQGFVNGMAKWEAAATDFYVEQAGIVADALQEALVQDYDGVIRIAPAIPPGWDFDGSVFVRGRTKVDVQTRNGAVSTVVIEAGSNGTIKLRNPWPGSPVDVLSGKAGTKVVSANLEPVIEFKVAAGTSYLIERRDMPVSAARFAPLSGEPASSAKKFGPVQIGLFAEAQ